MPCKIPFFDIFVLGSFLENAQVFSSKAFYCAHIRCYLLCITHKSNFAEPAELQHTAAKQEAFLKKCWAHSLLRAASRPFTRCRQRYCRAPPAHRCPRRQRQRRQRQRQRVTEGTAMAPWNGPNYTESTNKCKLQLLTLLVFNTNQTHKLVTDRRCA